MGTSLKGMGDRRWNWCNWVEGKGVKRLGTTLLKKGMGDWSWNWWNWVKGNIRILLENLPKYYALKTIVEISNIF